MGFLSKFFGTKMEERPKKQASVSFEVKSDVTYMEPEIPPLQGDYAKTIFLWAHKKASKIRENSEYARYFLYECGIRDSNQYHKELIGKGYFREASDEAKLSVLKVSDLKNILKELEQPVTGKKEELIDRILEHAAQEKVREVCPDVLYELTEAGEEFLKEHNDYVLIHTHKNWGIDWKTYDRVHKDGYNFFDTMWGIFNQRIIENNHDFGRNEYLNMYQLLVEEGKRNRALEMLLRVLYIDLSGVEGLENFRLYKQGVFTKKELKDFFSVAIMLAPGIVNPIGEYKDVYQDSYIEKIYEQKLPVQICEKELFKEIVYSVLDDSYEESKVQNKLRRAYNEVIDKM